MRPEVLELTEKIIVPRRPGYAPFLVYELAHMDDLYREYTQNKSKQVGSIIMWCGDETRQVPGEMFKTFDWVICSLIPQSFWDPDGKVRPHKHGDIPDLVSNRQQLMFFGGFE